jgi:hypothetical protein
MGFDLTTLRRAAIEALRGDCNVELVDI